MGCKGICDRYKAVKPVEGGRYEDGQRRCQICEIFIKWEGLWCPCCGYRLRTKPRNKVYKAKLMEKTPHFGIIWDTYTETNGVMTLTPDQAVLIRMIDDSMTGFEKWECMAGKTKCERFIQVR